MIRELIAPDTTALTTLARVKDDLRLTTDDAARDRWLEARIVEASDLIQRTVGRVTGEALARAQVLERLPGTNRPELLVSRTPVTTLASVTECDVDAPCSDVEVYDAEAGVLYRRHGFRAQPTVRTWLTPDVVEGPVRLTFDVTYTGGYLLPGDNVAASGATVAATTRRIALASGVVWPTLLASGDTLQFANFTNNRGRRTVVARIDDQTVQVAEAVADETAGGDAEAIVATLPPALEAFTLATVRAWYADSQREDPNVTQERIGDYAVTFGKGAGLRTLPAEIAEAVASQFGRTSLGL